MPPPLKRESWSLEDITMFGAAGGARWSLSDEAEVFSPATAGAAVACFTQSVSEIILPLLHVPSFHFTITTSFIIFFRFSYYYIILSRGPWPRPNVWKRIGGYVGLGVTNPKYLWHILMNYQCLPKLVFQWGIVSPTKTCKFMILKFDYLIVSFIYQSSKTTTSWSGIK